MSSWASQEIEERGELGARGSNASAGMARRAGVGGRGGHGERGSPSHFLEALDEQPVYHTKNRPNLRNLSGSPRGGRGVLAPVSSGKPILRSEGARPPPQALDGP